MRPVTKTFLTLTGAIVLITVPGRADMLLFNPTVGAFSNLNPLPQGYGNRITAADQGGFHYDLVGGATPNVVTQFATGSMPAIFTWDFQFGDLQNVIFAQEPRVFQFNLNADPGFLVTLNSFDMASWPMLDYTIKSVTIEDGNGAVLYSQSNPLIKGANSTHTHFSFNGVTANTLQIFFDSTNVDSDDVGIDNINFSQSRVVDAVPEPSGRALMGLVLVAVGVFRKNRVKEL
jgi:hypothetical protein